MEAFVNLPGVHAAWSSEIARLEHDGVRAVITTLVLEDSAQPTRKNVRGVRIDLLSATASDRIYLDEEATERTRAALVEIAEAVGRSGIRGKGCMGAKEFWPLYNWPWNKLHEWNADFCGADTDTALVLYGRGRPASFRFPEH